MASASQAGGELAIGTDFLTAVDCATSPPRAPLGEDARALRRAGARSNTGMDEGPHSRDGHRTVGEPDRVLPQLALAAGVAET